MKSVKACVTWGGDWSANIDRPPIEIKPIWIMSKGYKIEEQVIIPTNSKYQVQLIVEGNTTNQS
ncbi:hypothetical protein [Lysinibacillus fusiformis]|uniref:hypothetical protein n=1 Tax=Lysinibacillus fusiformis TaxID=28031 RepID=UPI00355607A4